jgi:hypothetical protein
VLVVVAGDDPGLLDSDICTVPCGRSGNGHPIRLGAASNSRPLTRIITAHSPHDLTLPGIALPSRTAQGECVCRLLRSGVLLAGLPRPSCRFGAHRCVRRIISIGAAGYCLLFGHLRLGPIGGHKPPTELRPDRVRRRWRAFLLRAVGHVGAHRFFVRVIRLHHSLAMRQAARIESSRPSTARCP